MLIRMLTITNSYCLIMLVFACNDLVRSGPRISEYKLLQPDHSECVDSPSAALFSSVVPCSFLGDALIQADHSVTQMFSAFLNGSVLGQCPWLSWSGSVGSRYL